MEKKLSKNKFRTLFFSPIINKVDFSDSHQDWYIVGVLVLWGFVNIIIDQKIRRG